jgi:hypothetical protein
MGIGEWFKNRRDKELALLLERLDAQATELLAFEETSSTLGITPSSEQSAYNLNFFRDFKVMITAGREDHAAGKTLPNEDVKHLLKLHDMFTERQAAIAQGKRVFKQRYG